MSRVKSDLGVGHPKIDRSIENCGAGFGTYSDCGKFREKELSADRASDWLALPADLGGRPCRNRTCQVRGTSSSTDRDSCSDSIFCRINSPFNAAFSSKIALVEIKPMHSSSTVSRDCASHFPFILSHSLFHSLILSFSRCFIISTTSSLVLSHSMFISCYFAKFFDNFCRVVLFKKLLCLPQDHLQSYIAPGRPACLAS